MERSVLREVLLTHFHDLNVVEQNDFKPASETLSSSFRILFGIPFLVSPLLVSRIAPRCQSDDIVALADPPAIARVHFHLRYLEQGFTYVRMFAKVSTNRFRPLMDQDALVERLLAFGEHWCTRCSKRTTFLWLQPVFSILESDRVWLHACMFPI